MRKRLAVIFEKSELNGRILSRAIMENNVVGHEVVTWKFPEGKQFYVRLLSGHHHVLLFYHDSPEHSGLFGSDGNSNYIAGAAFK